MQIRKKLTLVCIFSILFLFSAQSQSCVNCDATPKIIQFGFDVQIATPNKDEGTANLWPEWNTLFILGDIIASKLMNENKGCLKFTIPPSVDTGDIELLKIGTTAVNLPSNPLISANLSVYGNYLLTGHISRTGENCVLHAELQSSCGRDIVASADINFPLESLIQNTELITEQAVQQLSPLADKIKQFELDQRNKDKKLSLIHLGEDPIRVILTKKTLSGGESMSFEVELKDCDGTPLEGREIIFSEATFGGFALHKTIGGTITPKVVTTDAQGRAQARFTLNRGAKEAVINAHSIGKDVRGCPSVFTGSEFINVRTVYSGYVTYKYSSINNCIESSTLSCLASSFRGNHDQSIEYTASFYQTTGGGNDAFVSFNNSDQDASPVAVPNSMESGNYSLRTLSIRKSVIVCESANKGLQSIQRITSDAAGKLEYGGMSFTSSDGKQASLGLGFSFATTNHGTFQQTYLQSSVSDITERISWSFYFDSSSDKEISFKKEQQGNKIKYTIEGTRIVTGKCNSLTEESVKMVIWEE